MNTPSVPIVSAAAPVEPGLPCPTIHVSNLNERIHPRHMISELEKIMSVYGQILSIQCKRKLSLKGQAFVEFASVESAQRAIANLQTRTLYQKSMVLRFAKRRSNLTVKRQSGSRGLKQEQALRMQEKLERARNPRLTRRQRFAQAVASGAAPVVVPGVGGVGVLPNMMPVSSVNPQAQTMSTIELPNKTVFVQNLPAEATDDELITLFKRYIGFVELRRIPTRPEIAFVEYETDAQAGVVRVGLDRHELRPNRPMRVTFARR